jgi:hypothetical protein
MLVEEKAVRQIKDEGFRRWFLDEDFDLIIWYENNEIVGFQLCYDKKDDNEKALTWRKGDRYVHNKIDNGESSYSNKMTPILVSDGIFNKSIVAERFRGKAIKMEYGLADFIYRKLQDYT